MAKIAKIGKIAKTVKKWRLNVKNGVFAKIGKTVKNVQKRGQFAKTPFFSLFKMSGVPESMEMSLFGPLFDRSGKYLDYLVPKSRGFWPEGEKGGQKRGPKMGHFGGSPNLSKPSKMMKFPCFWSKFHVFETPDPKMTHFGTPFWPPPVRYLPK